MQITQQQCVLIWLEIKSYDFTQANKNAYQSILPLYLPELTQQPSEEGGGPEHHCGGWGNDEILIF